jgi:hypothetical protein
MGKGIPVPGRERNSEPAHAKDSQTNRQESKNEICYDAAAPSRGDTRCCARNKIRSNEVDVKRERLTQTVLVIVGL